MKNNRDRESLAEKNQRKDCQVTSSCCLVLLLTFAPVFTPLNSPSVTFLGLHAMGVWFTLCFALYVLLVLVFYLRVFRYWKVPRSGESNE